MPATRRAFLTAGLGLGGAAIRADPPRRAKSVVWLWLAGGPSQLETFDPQPDAPDECRSITGSVRTRLPGVRLAGGFPLLADRMDRLAVLRNFGHTNPSHGGATHWLMTGHDHPTADDGVPPTHPGLGAIIARHHGAEAVRLGPIFADGPVTRDVPTPDRLDEQLRTARQLCEAGVGFVGVPFGDWDTHADLTRRMQILAPRLDRAVAGFLDDVADRGLSDDILLVVTGEFGRTPRLNRHGGRDHWPANIPLLLAGGGLRMGQVIDEPAGPGDLLASLFYILGVPADPPTASRPIRGLV